MITVGLHVRHVMPAGGVQVPLGANMKMVRNSDHGNETQISKLIKYSNELIMALPTLLFLHMFMGLVLNAACFASLC